MRAEGDIRVRAGDLRHPITIQKLGPTSPPTIGPTGGVVMVFADYLINVPAQIQVARASQVVRGGQAVTLMVVPISMRYDARILAGMQAKFVNQPAGITDLYEILAISNIDKRNWSMDLDCIALGVTS